MFRRLKFLLERWIQRGVLHQLFFVAGTIVAISVVGGVIAWLGTSKFAHVGEGVWWAFLRLTDPGYLGDDEGALLRVVSTTITVLGYVVFMGSLIAILTQWLTKTIRNLEGGHTPISMRDHIVILGWTNRTAEIVDKLLRGRGRLDRFLKQRDARTLRVVVLASDVGSDMRRELRDHLQDAWSDDQVFLRSGSSLQPEHLQRLDLARAAVVVVPGADFEIGGAELTDARVVKTLLTLDQILRNVPADGRPGRGGPAVVAEVFDPLKLPIARGALDERLEVIASDAVISRLISQCVRHRRLARVFFEILSHREGSSIYVRALPGYEGYSAAQLNRVLDRAVVLGLLREKDGARTTILNPAPDCLIEAGDQVVFLAPSYSDCAPTTADVPPVAAPPAIQSTTTGKAERPHSILILGWSYKIGSILSELGSSKHERFEVTILSRISPAERDKLLATAGFDTDRVKLQHVEVDYCTPAGLESVRPEMFDSFVLLASAWMDSSETADARTILGYVLLRSILKPHRKKPEILVELLDPTSSTLFPAARDTLLVSPRILSHLLAHVSLRSDLNSVFEALFIAGGAEITLRTPSEYGVAGATATFAQLQEKAHERAEIALGVLGLEGDHHTLRLTPAPNESWAFRERDEIVVLASADALTTAGYR